MGMITELEKKAKKYVEDGSLDLDGFVDELKAQEATEINNSGVLAQFNYIVERAGYSYMKDIVG